MATKPYEIPDVKKKLPAVIQSLKDKENPFSAKEVSSVQAAEAAQKGDWRLAVWCQDMDLAKKRAKDLNARACIGERTQPELPKPEEVGAAVKQLADVKVEKPGEPKAMSKDPLRGAGYTGKGPTEGKLPMKPLKAAKMKGIFFELHAYVEVPAADADAYLAMDEDFENREMPDSIYNALKETCKDLDNLNVRDAHTEDEGEGFDASKKVVAGVTDCPELRELLAEALKWIEADSDSDYTVGASNARHAFMAKLEKAVSPDVEAAVAHVRAAGTLEVVFNNDGTYHPFQNHSEAVSFLKKKESEEPDEGWKIGTRVDGVNYAAGEGPFTGDDATEEVRLWVLNDETLYNASRKAKDAQDLKNLILPLLQERKDIRVDVASVDWDEVYSDCCEEDETMMASRRERAGRIHAARAKNFGRLSRLRAQRLNADDDSAKAEEIYASDEYQALMKNLPPTMKASYNDGGTGTEDATNWVLSQARKKFGFSDGVQTHLYSKTHAGFS